MFPDDRSYTAEHEWARLDGGRVRIGITDYAQRALGDVVFVTLPAAGEQVTAGAPLGEVESTKSVSDVYAPLSGVVAARNEALDSTPELVNSDPYGDGWLIEIEVGRGPDRQVAEQALAAMLDAAGYRAHVEA